MGRYSERRDRVCRHAAAAAQLLDRKGITDPMWDMLLAVFQARTNKERGLRAPLSDQTLNALYKRGLVTGRSVRGYDGWIWFVTDAGKRLALDGRDTS